MSAVLLAVFNEHGAAERVRTRLVGDGFPTDRVRADGVLRARRAGRIPQPSARARFVQYFRTLLSEDDERPFVELLVERVEGGARPSPFTRAARSKRWRAPRSSKPRGRWNWSDTTSRTRPSSSRLPGPMATGCATSCSTTRRALTASIARLFPAHRHH